MNLGESFEDVAKREVLEETGLVVKDLKLLELFSGDKLHYTYPNGDEAYSVIALYESKSFEGILIPEQSETEELRFFDMTDLPKNIAPPKIVHEFLLNHYS
ncbi:NUDIX domain-containing protein [Macrococcus brunensis]|uniref:NUDIX domain-containing protein n=1 Tax=Macrococcus brunensis TaxID=198483 RepID=UPI001FB6F2A4|nr:NUDIX domain-containing protein [Macrococcus brunensis]